MEKKIIVIHCVHTLFGGVASVVYGLINHQLNNNILPILLYVHYDKSVEKAIPTSVRRIKIDISERFGRMMLLGMDIKKEYKKLEEDYPDSEIIIHAHNLQTIGLLTTLKDINLICTLHSMHGKTNLRSILSDIIYKLSLSKLKKNDCKIVSVSNAIAKFYDPKGKFNIRTIHNGSVNGGFSVIDPPVFSIAHIGDISYAKGFDKEFSAYMNLSKEIRNNLDFIIAGKTKTITEDDLLRMISESDTKHRIKWLGFVENANRFLFPKVSVLLLASLNEGLPMSIVEAFSYGIPVIATPVGGIPEIIQDGINGFLVKNEDEMSSRIKQLYSNKELYKMMKKNAYDTYTKRFSSKIMNDAYWECYRELLHK